MPTLTEADTCRTYVVPKLYAAGWTDDQISEQKSFTDGRIIVAGDKPRRRPQKRADYLLRYRRDYDAAVCEALLLAGLIIRPTRSVELWDDVSSTGVSFGERGH